MEIESGNTSKATQDETLLIRYILDGHTEQFRLLADRYAGQVLRMVARLIPSPEEAEEAAQDALLNAFLSLCRFDARQASFRTWLMRIAYHTALKHYRQRQKSPPFVEVNQHRFDSIPDDETDNLLNETAADRVALMERAIGMLKPEDQMLLSFYYFDNRPIREISGIMEHEEGYLRSRLQWIRKRMATIIKNFENNEEK